MTHIYVGKLYHHCFRYGLSPERLQTIIWANDEIVNWTLRNKLQWNFNQNSNIFIQGNALENVVGEMTAILSRSQCVKCLHYFRVFWYVYTESFGFMWIFGHLHIAFMLHYCGCAIAIHIISIYFYFRIDKTHIGIRDLLGSFFITTDISMSGSFKKAGHCFEMYWVIFYNLLFCVFCKMTLYFTANKSV